MTHGLADRSAPRKHLSSVTDGVNVTQEAMGVSLGSPVERPCTLLTTHATVTTGLSAPAGLRPR